MSGFTCPGRELPQPSDAPEEGYVACYRAGHVCPPKVATVEQDETHRTTTYRCPCCGDLGVMFSQPLSWLTTPDGDNTRRPSHASEHYPEDMT